MVEILLFKTTRFNNSYVIYGQNNARAESSLFDMRCFFHFIILPSTFVNLLLFFFSLFFFAFLDRPRLFVRKFRLLRYNPRAARENAVPFPRMTDLTREGPSCDRASVYTKTAQLSSALCELLEKYNILRGYFIRFQI